MEDLVKEYDKRMLVDEGVMDYDLDGASAIASYLSSIGRFDNGVVLFCWFNKVVEVWRHMCTATAVDQPIGHACGTTGVEPVNNGVVVRDGGCVIGERDATWACVGGVANSY